MEKTSQNATFGVQASLAKMYPLQEHANAPDSTVSTQASSSILPASLMTLAPLSSFSKTCQAFFLPTVDEISESFSVHWQNSGMAWPGECLTVSTSASPSHVVDSTLLDILETRPEQQHYYLSPNAAQGILRRADSQGRNLFPPLRKSLETLAADLSSQKSGTA